MLRVHTKSCPEVIPGLHHPQYTVGANSLHRLGQTFVQVRTHKSHMYIQVQFLIGFFHTHSQLFGEHNEDEEVSPDTADPEAAASAGDAALNTEANTEV